ncbi:DUF1292 domain-containing protein [Haloimpatiens sp. FM7330]|uniref:DUF1292 domain-containing protein n=1 Tax=Haloimpatiens sp. FM7330 TaxID=3298610 RepID=UPI0036326F18
MNKTETVTILDENGNKKELDIIDMLNVDNKQYVIVSSKGSEDAYAYRAEQKGNEIEYTSIGEGQEFNKVLEAYNSKHE